MENERLINLQKDYRGLSDAHLRIITQYWKLDEERNQPNCSEARKKEIELEFKMVDAFVMESKLSERLEEVGL